MDDPVIGTSALELLRHAEAMLVRAERLEREIKHSGHDRAVLAGLLAEMRGLQREQAIVVARITELVIDMRALGMLDP